MIVLDVESTGVDARLCSLLSVGAVDFDAPANCFYAECHKFPGAHVEKEAAEIHGFTVAQMEDEKKRTDREVLVDFLVWMRTCKEWTLAGQNPAFDRDFLQETAHRYHIDWPFAQRTVDLHSVAYYHMKGRGVEVPLLRNHSALNLDRILAYTGLKVARGKHNALEDAKLEAEAFQRLFYGRSLLEECENFAIPDFLRER